MKISSIHTLLSVTALIFSGLTTAADSLDDCIKTLNSEKVTIIDYKQQYNLLKNDKTVPRLTVKLLFVIQSHLDNNERRNRVAELTETLATNKERILEARVTLYTKATEKNKQLATNLLDLFKKLNDRLKAENMALLSNDDLHQLYHECLIEYAYRGETKLLTLAAKYYQTMMKPVENRLILKPEFILKMEKINPDYFPPASLKELIDTSSAKLK